MKHAQIIGVKTHTELSISAAKYKRFIAKPPTNEFVGALPKCLVCGESVFHVERKRIRHPINFFSHFPKTPKSPPCDLRLKYIRPEILDAIARAHAKSYPYLVNFIRIIDQFYGKVGIKFSRTEIKWINDLVKDMGRNWYKEREIKEPVQFQTLQENFAIMIAPIFKKTFKSLVKMRIGYLRTIDQIQNTIAVWQCLHIPREKLNTRYLMKTALQFAHRNSCKLRKGVSSFQEDVIFFAFALLSLIPWILVKKNIYTS